MGLVAKLQFGENEFDLNDGSVFGVGLGYVPPALNVIPVLSPGTSRNRHAGDIVVDRRYGDREISVPLILRGSAAREVQWRLEELNGFIQAGFASGKKMYFVTRGDNGVPFEPLWGQQGAYRRYEVKVAHVEPGSRYAMSVMGTSLPDAVLLMRVGPVALGKEQQVGSAIGGVIMQRAGVSDQLSRGVQIYGAITNHFTNPIYGHATWNNGWTAGADLLAEQNTDERYVYAGKASAKITRTQTGGGASGYTQSLNVGSTATHYLSFRAKKRDGSAITTSDVQTIYNSAAQNVTTVALGNGWYLCYASVTGVNGAVDGGVKALVVGQTIYVDGFQIELSVPSGLTYGDLMDCAWTGTAHASTSTRTAARVRLAGAAVSAGEGTIRMAWRAPVANTVYTTDRILFETSGGMVGKYDGANARWYFNDGTNAIVGTANTFAAGDILLLHFVYEPGSMKIYLNGAQIATGSGYTPEATGAYVYVGSDVSAANHMTGIIHGFTTFAQAMSATEAAADYAQLTPLLSNYERVDWLPCLWTDDGDDTLDNCLQGSTYENAGDVIDVPGSLDAITKIDCDSSSTFVSRGGFLFSLLKTRRYYDYLKLFSDQSGNAEANTCGGEYAAYTLNSTPGGITHRITGLVITQDVLDMLSGKRFILVARVKGAADYTAVNIRGTYRIGNDEYNMTDAKYVTIDSSGYNFLYTDPIEFKDYARYGAAPGGAAPIMEIYCQGAAGTEQLRVDFYMVLVSPWICVLTYGASTSDKFIFNSDTGEVYDDVIESDTLAVLGDIEEWELSPEMHNKIIVASGIRPGNAWYTNAITDTLLFNSIKVTPRWAVL